MSKITNIDLPDKDSKKSTTSIPSVVVPGDIVSRYNDARDQVDRATEVMDELKPTLIEAGLQAVFEHNSQHPGDSKNQINSVSLQDATDPESVEVCMFSWTRKNLKNDPKQVEAEFKRLKTLQGKKVDVNDHVAYVPVVTFDSAALVVDGEFSRLHYRAFENAIAKVAKELGIENPFTVTKVLVPKPEFHDKRWENFDVESNIAIQTVLPTQCNLKPVRPENGE